MADFTEDNSRGIPVDRQITFPSITGDLIWDIDQLPLTRVHSGDCDNSVYISFLGDNREAKRRYLKKYCRPNFIRSLEVKIFHIDITDDELRKIYYMLTLYDAITTVLIGSGVLCSIDELFFAALVNYNYSTGKARNRINSYGALMDIKSNENINNSGELNYAEYILLNDEPLDIEYKTIPFYTNDYSCNFTIRVPIVNCRFGRFRFATAERLPATLSWLDSSEETNFIIPPVIWHAMVAEGLARRHRIKFFKGESKNLHEYFNIDPKFIDEICDESDFRVIASFVNDYTLDVDETYHFITIYNTKDKPVLNTRRLHWEQKSENSNDYILYSDYFYVAKISSATVQIRMYK